MGGRKRACSSYMSSDAMGALSDSQRSIPSTSTNPLPVTVRVSKKSKTSTNNCGNDLTQSFSQLPSSEQMIDDAINQVISQGDTHGLLNDLQSEIYHLREIILQQSTTIEKLSLKMATVMSYLELSDDKITSSTQNGPGQNSAIGSDQSSPPHEPTNFGSLSWSSVERRNPSKRGTVTTAAVAAMYYDGAERTRRATSLVVSGLPIDDAIDDTSGFVELCRSHLNTDVDVMSSKRLGNVIPGKIQPLMVILRTQQAAQHLLSIARNLRNSNDEYVRSHIYFNPNRTKAEAEAAFQIRQNRRLAAIRKASSAQQQNPTSVSTSSSSSASSSQQNAPERSSLPTTNNVAHLGSATATATTGSCPQLNVSALPFNPNTHIERSHVAQLTQQFMLKLFESAPKVATNLNTIDIQQSSRSVSATTAGRHLNTIT